MTRKSRNRKELSEAHKSTGGRNHQGRITCYHRGGGHKRRQLRVNFQYATRNPDGYVVEQVYDSHRGGAVGLIQSKSTGELEYRLLSKDRKVGRTVATHTLGELGAHTQVYNVELYPGQGAQLIRCAGSFGTIVNHVGGYTRVRLPSGEQRLIHSKSQCRVGVVGGVSEKRRSLKLHLEGKGKAGRSRWLGTRPTVRGTARNPIDHPHGGGQGKTSGGRPSVTPWSVAKGVRTTSGRGANYVVVRRREAIS
jgi:large subunit ribosomal protein L2